MILLKETRQAAGLSQQELAKLANVPQQTISAIEKKTRNNPGANTLHRLACALNKTMDDLYVEEGAEDEGVL